MLCGGCRYLVLLLLKRSIPVLRRIERSCYQLLDRETQSVGGRESGTILDSNMGEERS